MIPIYRVNCGGPAVDQYEADRYYTGGLILKAPGAPADRPLWKSARYGTFSYSFPIAEAGLYHVQCQCPELYYTSVGKRRMSLAFNGIPWLLGTFDPFAIAGLYGPVEAQSEVRMDVPGVIKIDFVGIAGGATVSDISIWTSDGPVDETVRISKSILNRWIAEMQEFVK